MKLVHNLNRKTSKASLANPTLGDSSSRAMGNGVHQKLRIDGCRERGTSRALSTRAMQRLVRGVFATLAVAAPGACSPRQASHELVDICKGMAASQPKPPPCKDFPPSIPREIPRGLKDVKGIHRLLNRELAAALRTGVAVNTDPPDTSGDLMQREAFYPDGRYLGCGNMGKIRGTYDIIDDSICVSAEGQRHCRTLYRDASGKYIEQNDHPEQREGEITRTISMFNIPTEPCGQK